MSALELRVARLEQQVATLQGGRPGRKPKPVVISEEGVCGIEPGRDSANCSDASLYRYQKGCKGIHCSQIHDTYYERYRQAQKVALKKK